MEKSISHFWKSCISRLVGYIETCRVQYLCLGWWEFQQTSQFRGQRSRTWRNWYIIFDNIAISTCGTDTCWYVQVQYLCLGSWAGFQRAKYFLGQNSRSWWNWSAMSWLVGDIETWKVQYLCLGSWGFQRASIFTDKWEMVKWERAKWEQRVRGSLWVSRRTPDTSS
jgi:hypothetical protein